MINKPIKSFTLNIGAFFRQSHARPVFHSTSRGGSKLKTNCQFMSRIIALIYNCWNLFVRLAIPEKHHEAITSRPLLLSSIGKLTEHSRQKKMTITSTHGDTTLIKTAYSRINTFFNELKLVAPQLTIQQSWNLILAKAMEVFRVKLTIIIKMNYLCTLNSNILSFWNVFMLDQTLGRLN